MMIKYKKLDDPLSPDDYNALCYLLEHEEHFSESIPFELNKEIKGIYGTYKFTDPNGVLSEDKDGYQIVKTKEDGKDIVLNLTIKHIYTTARFGIHFNVYAPRTEVHNTSEGTVDVQYRYNEINDFMEEIDIEDYVTLVPSKTVEVTSEENPNNTYELVHNDIITTRNDDVTTTTVKINLLNMGYKYGYFLKDNVDIYLDYNKPEINLEDGNLTQTDEIICETFEDVERAVKTCPSGQTLKLRLMGRAYDWKRTIVIGDYKTVILRGGNININNENKPYTVLDAKYRCRHFTINSTGVFTIENCRLIKGNVYGINSHQTQHQRGGSIYIGNPPHYIGGNYIYFKTQATINNCYFEDNIAGFGGAIYNTSARVDVTNSTFIRNIALYYRDYVSEPDVNNITRYRKQNVGGAIRSESRKGTYNEAFDRIRVGTCTISDGKVNIPILSTQNAFLFSNENINMAQTKTSDWTLLNYTDKTEYKCTYASYNKNTSILKLSFTTNPDLSSSKKYYVRYNGDNFYKNIITKQLVGG